MDRFLSQLGSTQFRCPRIPRSTRSGIVLRRYVSALPISEKRPTHWPPRRSHYGSEPEPPLATMAAEYDSMAVAIIAVRGPCLLEGTASLDDVSAARSDHRITSQARSTAPAQTHTSCWWGGAPNLTRTARFVQAIACAGTCSSTPSSHSTQACTRCGMAGVQTVNCPICSGSRLRGSRWARRGSSVMLQHIEQAFGCQGSACIQRRRAPWW